MDGSPFSANDFAELRRRVAAAADFGRFWDYFFTDFVERPGFLQLGQPATVPGVAAVLSATAGLMLGRPGPIPAGGLTLVEIPQGIIHGSCLFDGRVGAIVYVPAIDVGMVALMGSGGHMSYSRFVLQSDQEARAAAC